MLLLIVALMAISAATLVTSIAFDIKRDREEETIHRGVQYSRAIRLYYRKFGRYPRSIDDLLSANQMRFLRKRYKDPMTGNDFKVLHFGEVQMSIGGAMGGGLIPGAGVPGANGSNGQNPNSPVGQASAFENPESDASDGSTQSSSGSQSASTNDTNDSSDPSASDQPAQTFGGGPIVGVASTSKGTSIREFDKKRKYNEWLYLYTPLMERWGLIKTPYQAQQLFQGVMPQPTVLPGQTTGYGTGAPGVGAPPTSTNGENDNNNQSGGPTEQQP